MQEKLTKLEDGNYFVANFLYIMFIQYLYLYIKLKSLFG